MLLEQGPTKMHCQGPFVATVAATNLGDVSTNTAGPIFQDKSLPCDGSTNTDITFGPEHG